jgi:hypothetical protein
MQNFIKVPLSSLVRYERLLKSIQKATPLDSEDRTDLANVLTLLNDLRKDTDIAVTSAVQKVELQKYNESLVFTPGEFVDLDLLDESRNLIFAGKLTQQPEGEFFVLLFDNYCGCLCNRIIYDADGMHLYSDHDKTGGHKRNNGIPGSPTSRFTHVDKSKIFIDC